MCTDDLFRPKRNACGQALGTDFFCRETNDGGKMLGKINSIKGSHDGNKRLRFHFSDVSV